MSAGPHTRIWNDGFTLLYSSRTDQRTPEQFMIDSGLTEAHYTVDFPPHENWRTRQGGKLVKGSDGTVSRRRWDLARPQN